MDYNEFPPLENQASWVVMDPHIHSIYSGGTFSPLQILNYALAHNLDVVAISDHHQVQGAMEGREIANLNPEYPAVIISQEISAGDHFHLLVLGSQVKWSSMSHCQLFEALKQHRQDGGAIILAHPWSLPKANWAKGFLQDLLSSNLIDAVELFNSSISILSPERLAGLQSIWEELILPNKLGVVGGSDFHQLSKGRYIGSGRTYLKVKTTDAAGVIEAIRSRRCVAGLYSREWLDLAWLGSGFSFLQGNDPWFGELESLRREVVAGLQAAIRLEPVKRRIISGLLADGQIPKARELLVTDWY